MNTRYPLLLSLSEPGTLVGHYADAGRPMPTDVYLTHYQPGASLDQDLLSPLQPISVHEQLDEVGLALSGEGLWLSQDDRVYLQHSDQSTTELPGIQALRMAASPDGNFLWAHVRERGKHKIRQWTPSTDRWDAIWTTGQVQSFHPHPCQSKLHFVTRPGYTGKATVREWDAASGRLRELDFPFQAEEVQFSPDGKVLAFVDSADAELKTYHLEGGEISRVSDFRSECQWGWSGWKTHSCPQWSPDGRRLFYVLNTGDIFGDTLVYGETLMVASPDGLQRKPLLGLRGEPQGCRQVRTSPIPLAGQNSRSTGLDTPTLEGAQAHVQD